MKTGFRFMELNSDKQKTDIHFQYVTLLNGRLDTQPLLITFEFRIDWWGGDVL